MNNNELNNPKITPAEYFQIVKERKQTITNETLQSVYDNCLFLLEKCKRTGQIETMKKIIFHLESIEKEKKLIDLGVNKFIYRDDIDTYIDDVADNAVVLIDLEHYTREIPDEIVETIEKTKDIFDKMYVVFTDYTGKERKKIEKEKRVKDPILFGVFTNVTTRTTNERFYFLGDWIDEYCNLTFDKLVGETNRKLNKNIEITIKTPEDIEELKMQLNQLITDKSGDFRMINTTKKKPFFAKIKTTIKGLIK